MLTALCLALASQPDLPRVSDFPQIVWATAETSSGPKPLALELHWPAKTRAASPVVLVVDPSGAGTTRERAHAATIDALLARGVAVATTTIRTSGEAEFPAQVHDLKGAVRFLRANSARLGLDPGRIGVWGEGDGATLAALLGTSGNVAALEGVVGGNARVSSRVQAVVEVSGLLDLEDAHVAPQVEGVPTPRLVGLSTSARDLGRARAASRATIDAVQGGAGSIEADSSDTVPRTAPGIRERRSREARQPRTIEDLPRVDTATDRRARGSDGLEAPSLRALAPEPETIAPEEALRFASPRHHVSADDPPMFLAEAASGPGAPASQARTMRGRLLEHGVPVVLAEWPLGDSGIGTERLPRTTLASAADFARSVLASSNSIAPIGAGEANSIGTRASIWSTGLASPSTPFWLHVEGALPNTTGAFVLGETLDQQFTTADGVRLAPPLVRLPPVETDARGNAVQTFAIPHEWVGLTLFFQFEYVDRGAPTGDGSGMLLSRGGRVSICRSSEFRPSPRSARR